jgi:hypothetical protein
MRLAYLHCPSPEHIQLPESEVGNGSTGGGHRAAVSLLASAGCDVVCGRALSTLPPDRSLLFGFVWLSSRFRQP